MIDVVAKALEVNDIAKVYDPGTERTTLSQGELNLRFNADTKDQLPTTLPLLVPSLTSTNHHEKIRNCKCV